MKSLSKDYQTSYEETFKVMDASPEDIISSLCFLVEEMLGTIQKLEENDSKKSDAMKIELEI